MGRFTERLSDRALMSAIIHVGVCRNVSCITRNGELQRLLLSNRDIPGALIARMEYWRSKVEGYPPRPKKTLGSEKDG